MANFSNGDFAGQNWKDVSGVGATRYRNAYQHILDNYDSFDVQDGLNALKKAIQSSGGYKTQCSMVFDPENNEVYIVLHRNFNKIYKLSINNGTLETYSGFEKNNSFTINQTGITSTQLKKRTSVKNEHLAMPENVILKQNYPNPFNGHTQISYFINKPTKVNLKIFNTTGQEIETLVSEQQNPGNYSVMWNAANQANALYFYVLETEGKKYTGKMLYVK